MSVDMARCAITVELEEPLSPGWEKVPGVTLDRSCVTIDPDNYFYRYESPAWKICDWEGVRRDLLPVAESSDEALEQTALNYIKKHGCTTEDAVEVLQIAEQVYSYLFRPECLDEPDLKAMGVNSAHRDASSQDAREIWSMHHVKNAREIGVSWRLWSWCGYRI